MLEEQVQEWTRRWFEESREEGREQGRTEERALLRRLTARKFDAVTAERLSGVLNGLADPERLAEIGEWIIECETGAELLGRTGGRRRLLQEPSPHPLPVAPQPVSRRGDRREDRRDRQPRRSGVHVGVRGRSRCASGRHHEPSDLLDVHLPRTFIAPATRRGRSMAGRTLRTARPAGNDARRTLHRAFSAKAGTCSVLAVRLLPPRGSAVRRGPDRGA